MRQLLGLDENISEFEITYGLLPRSRHEVAILPRSMMWGIDLPVAHVTEGRVTPGLRQAGDASATPLVHIRSGTKAPEDAYAAVHYKGYWYWIDDSDIAGKRTFTFLLILSSLAETGQSSAVPMVTVPSR